MPAGPPQCFALPDVDPGAAAQILYTSGTTGRPRAAVLTHQALTNNARLASEAIGMQRARPGSTRCRCSTSPRAGC